ncbi:TonB-dependent receptor [Erythrobacter sp. JK5]|uniref:TonB-dependent receptor domain-containing protein n=1 Tax=Erythrobacter sp. JK5 TaxID=2829500 RepID=UPI001BAE2F2B|nr:TonB-dependent receptor [Erythrobacter sp. JK5]QUL38776.1 TonB-dependent receptor [Erythrobacter sp. JK5]
MTRSCVMAAVLASTALAPFAASAQEAAPGAPPAAGDEVKATGTGTFPAAFFAPFAPRNALDMVLRVPGFTLRLGNADSRGFAQAAGNVVINGKRPSSKSDPLVDVLERIPANRVVRIEIGPGQRYGADYAGEVQVANVVLSAEDGVSGNVVAALERNFAGRLTASADGSASWISRRHTLALAGSYTNGPSDEVGIDRLFLPGVADPISVRPKTIVIDEPVRSVSFNYAFDGETLDSAHLNLRYARTGFDYLEDLKTVAGPTSARDVFRSDYVTDEFEIGADATLKALGGATEFVVLHSRRDRLFEDLFAFDVESGVVDGFSQILDDRLTETIGRITHSRAVLGGASLQVGIEGARNVLDSQVQLSDLASGAAIDLPVDDVTVSEDRAEAFATLGFGVTDKLRIETGLRFEHSRLSVTGDAEAERTLSFVKPNISLLWEAPDQVSVQLSIERTVSQLDFDDFVSFAELRDDRINGGNAELRPQRAWEVKLTAERPILRDGVARITLEYDRISQLQDRVPVEGGFDAPGNLGSADLWAVDATLELPLDRIGIAGGRITAQSSLVLTTVRDPYTLEPRRFSGVPIASVSVGFRRDGKRTAWGFDLSGSSESTSFRRDEFDISLSRFPDASVFYQIRPDDKSTLTFSLSNLFDVPTERRRVFFSPDRSQDNPVLIETRRNDSHLVPRISYKRSF